MQKINIGIIGIGHLGSRHLKVLSELSAKATLTGICDLKEKETRELAQQYGVPYFKNYSELLSRVNAVSICVPTSLHHQVAKESLSKKIHTFIEKPMTTNLADADELIALAEKNDLKLQIGHVERFNSAFQAIENTARNPLFVECHRLNHFPNRSLDIGVVMDLMIHDIDIILGLMDSPVKEVHAVGVNVLTKFEDIANARITFENGSVCNLTASRVSDDIMRKIRIFLKDAYISLDYVNQSAKVYRRNLMMITKKDLPIEQEEPLKKELDSFLDAVRENKKPVVSGREGREALKLALKITQVLWDNPLIKK